MGTPLRVLVVEDEEQDAALLVRQLERGGFDVSFERVDTAEAMSAALSRRAWDVIVSDYSLPRFSGPMALALVKEHRLDLPFIIVSGNVAEDTAVEAMRVGAHDFMTKGKFARLIPAIQRELREAASRAEQARMREQLVIADRMASVGTLAAGVAHEINNPLATLVANLAFVTRGVERLKEELARRDRDEDADLRAKLVVLADPLADASECADQVRRIARDLKTFSRFEDEARTAVDIHRVIDSALKMAANELRHRACVRKDLGEVPLVDGNAGRLGQVFLNLLVNAAQAFEEGRVDDNEIVITTRLDERGRVVVDVLDTGPGMPESVRARVFDPFFTTKGEGEGSGLGLAICHRIVTSIGGQISVESQVGRGTTVRTVLPAARLPALGTAPPPSSVRVTRRGQVLVIDDDVRLGKAVQWMLSGDHEVTATTSAQEALDRLVRGEVFDVVLCDLMMPDMSGMDLYDAVSAQVPRAIDRLVFMTGGAFTARAREFLARIPNARVDKPFDEAALKATLARLVER